MTAGARGSGWAGDARLLYLVAGAVFLVTIAIGILNGSDLVTFDRNQLLTHVHSGTVGWMTLSIIATAFLMFRASDRTLAMAVAILVPVYVLAFYTGNLPFRAIGGTALLLAIAWLLVWLWRTYLAGDRTLPRLMVVLGLTSFGYGAVVGVLMQIAFALEITIIPGDAIGAHASAMTFAYLALVGMGLIEWRVLGTRGLPLLGVIQAAVLVVGGLIISFGLMAGAEQAAGGLYLLAQLTAVVLFIVRVVPTAVRRSWTDADPARHFAVASLWLVAALGMFMLLVFSIISNPEADTLDVGLLLASDHSVYIGVVTNIMLGVLALTVLRRDVPAWAAHLVFWGVNGGLLVFATGLVTEAAELKRIGAPVMGICLLIGLAFIGMRLMERPPADDAMRATD